MWIPSCSLRVFCSYSLMVLCPSNCSGSRIAPSANAHSCTSGQCTSSYLSGKLGIAPTRWVFGGRRHCCVICAHCAACRGGGGMWGILGKALKRAIWNTLRLHAVLTICLRLLSVLDGACVACCIFLSPGSYHVRIQIHSTGCCFPGCTSKAFGAQQGSLWGCRVGAGGSASCQAGQETSYNRFTETEIHARGRTSWRLSTP